MPRAEPRPTYAEYEPPAALRPFVQCFWTRLVPPATSCVQAHRVLPDGCVDLILTTGGEWSPADPTPGKEHADGALFVGAMTTALKFRSEPGTAFVGVRCRPGAARALFGVPAAELTDRRVAMDDLWRSPDAPSDGSDDPMRALTRLLTRRFAGVSPPPADVWAAVHRIRRSRGRIRIDALCADLGVTRQHLARRFAEHVGLPPKTFARVERIRHVIRLAHAPPAPAWSRIAQEAGYADQSHLVGEFGELVGLSPARWWAEGR